MDKKKQVISELGLRLALYSMDCKYLCSTCVMPYVMLCYVMPCAILVLSVVITSTCVICGINHRHVLQTCLHCFLSLLVATFHLVMCTGGLGGWSSEGCTTKGSRDRVDCSCKHLTTFAIVQV